MLRLHVVINLFAHFVNFLFFFFPGGGVKWGVSRVGRVQTDTKEEGWKFICPGQRGGLDRDRPDELQSSFNSFQLSVYTEKTPKKHPGYSQASPCETVLYVRCNKMKTYSLSDTRWWRPWRSGGPVGASIQVLSPLIVSLYLLLSGCRCKWGEKWAVAVFC